jgi:hypothetical protein
MDLNMDIQDHSSIDPITFRFINLLLFLQLTESMLKRIL